MAYGGGYEFGYQDGTGSWVFLPNIAAMQRKISSGDLWHHYGKAIPVQKTIIYTSGTGATYQHPTTNIFVGADTGSGLGDKMAYRAPSSIPITVTTAEALTIVADGSYGDYLSQEA